MRLNIGTKEQYQDLPTVPLNKKLTYTEVNQIVEAVNNRHQAQAFTATITFDLAKFLGEYDLAAGDLNLAVATQDNIIGIDAHYKIIANGVNSINFTGPGWDPNGNNVIPSGTVLDPGTYWIRLMYGPDGGQVLSSTSTSLGGGPAIGKVYGDRAAMLADQVSQQPGVLYEVTQDTTNGINGVAWWKKLATSAASINDYTLQSTGTHPNTLKGDKISQPWLWDHRENPDGSGKLWARHGFYPNLVYNSCTNPANGYGGQLNAEWQTGGGGAPAGGWFINAYSGGTGLGDSTLLCGFRVRCDGIVEMGTTYAGTQNKFKGFRFMDDFAATLWEALEVAAGLDRHVVDWGFHVNAGTMLWKGNWQATEYRKNHVVLDGDWTMIANKTTTDRAAPQGIGPKYWASALGDTPAWAQNSASVAQLIVGARYTFTDARFLYTGRYWIVYDPNITYEVWLVTDPLGNPHYNNILAEFTPTSDMNDTWLSIPLGQDLVPPGSVVDLLMVIRTKETENTFAYDWDYQRVNGDPASGVIAHQSGGGEMRVHQEDDGATDRTTDLDNIAPGSTINAGGIDWSVQAASKTGSVYTFLVQPVTRAAAGTYTVTFKWYGAQAIAYDHIVDHYQAVAEIQGIKIEGGGYPADVVLDDDAYGVDIEIQDALISPDWELVSFAGAGGVGGTDPGDEAVQVIVIDEATKNDAIVLTSELVEIQLAGDLTTDAAPASITGWEKYKNYTFHILKKTDYGLSLETARANGNVGYDDCIDPMAALIDIDSTQQRATINAIGFSSVFGQFDRLIITDCDYVEA